MAKKREVIFTLYTDEERKVIFEEREGYLEYIGQSTILEWYKPESLSYQIPLVKIIVIAAVSDKKTGQFYTILVDDIKEKLNAESRGSNEHGA